MRRALLLAALLALVAPGAADAERGPCRPGDPGSPSCVVWTARVLHVHDGDTMDVRLAGSRRVTRIRLTGLNAMEQTVYSSHPGRRRGACHALAATARAERLVRRSRGIVRLAAMDPASRSGARLRRAVAVRIDGRWRDLAGHLLGEGHAIWLPNSTEWAWNEPYRRLAHRASLMGTRLWDTSSCGAGPSEGAPLEVVVNWDADGADGDNVNGEWISVINNGPADVPLAGWWVRDSFLRRYVFPSSARVPARGEVRVHVGRGISRGTAFFWGQSAPAFENAGDGAYLFDPQGDLRAWDVYPD